MEESTIIKKHKPFSPTIKIALGYIAFILAGTLLLLMPFSSNSGQSVGFMPAFFTSTSAVCVTGLYVVDIYTSFNFFGQLVVILLVQFGGLGFMTMASLLLMMLGRRISLKDKLSIAESLSDDNMSTSLKTIKMIVITTACVEFLGAVCALPAFLQYEPGNVGLAIWRSVFNSIAAFCNAGFDLMGGPGMTPFVQTPLYNIVTITVILCGGLGPAVITNVAKRIRGKEKITFNSKMIIYSSLIALFGGGLYIFIAEFNNPATMGDLPLGDKILAALFQSMTTRSAGFSTIDNGALTAGGYLASNILMVIGVAPASTGGGIKNFQQGGRHSAGVYTRHMRRFGGNKPDGQPVYAGTAAVRVYFGFVKRRSDDGHNVGSLRRGATCAYSADVFRQGGLPVRGLQFSGA